MKLKHIATAAAALAIMAGFASFALADEEKEETVSMDKVPAAVKKTLAAYAEESEVKHIEKGEQEGKKVFEFDIEKAGRKFEVAISTKGKFMGTEEDVQLSDIPAAAQAALKAQAGDGKISGCEKAVDRKNKVTYEADIEKDGKKSEVAVDETGKVIKKESAEKDEKKDKD